MASSLSEYYNYACSFFLLADLLPPDNSTSQKYVDHQLRVNTDGEITFIMQVFLVLDDSVFTQCGYQSAYALHAAVGFRRANVKEVKPNTFVCIKSITFKDIVILEG